MNIIMHGHHDSETTAANLSEVLRLLKEQYNIDHFREIHLVLTLVNAEGDDVELVDTDTSNVYRILEVYSSGNELSTGQHSRPLLRLVIDNTR